MSLIDRLVGIEEPRIAVHYFYAAMTEVAAGEFTRAQLVNHFGLDAAEDTELGVIIGYYQATPADRKQEFLEFIHRIFMLAEAGAPGYTTGADLNSRLSRF